GLVVWPDEPSSRWCAAIPASPDSLAGEPIARPRLSVLAAGADFRLGRRRGNRRSRRGGGGRLKGGSLLAGQLQGDRLFQLLGEADARRIQGAHHPPQR